jgi:predicted GIY-YIG superfamily endonuclease
MDKATAQKLVQETLQDSFNRKRFVYLVKNVLNHVEEAPFTYKGNFIFRDFTDSIRLVERVGKYKGPDEKLIDILVVHLQKETSLERARTKQRNFVAKYLKSSRGGVLKDAALVAFVAPNGNDWRFSLVKMEYKFNEKGKVEEEFTPARRYSFLVGKNENSHTAQSRLLPVLLDDEVNPTLEELEDVFSIERVTKEFFEKYRDIFLRLKESLDDIVKKDAKVKADFKTKNIDTVDFAKKLLGQVVFLYFLQKKGWFGVKRGEEWGSGSKHFLRELFEKKHGDYKNFFNDILEPLFYEALRLERSLPAPQPNTFYVYAIKCDDGSLYIGQTDDLPKRWKEHVSGQAAEWTKLHKPQYIVHHEIYSTRDEAIKRERDLKTGFGRKWLKRKIETGRARQAGGQGTFDFEVYFSEVFHEKKGFDVVIANPPYVKEYVNKFAFDGLRSLPCYQGKMDLWYLFACKGLDIAEKGLGIVTFIAQNNWVTSYGASNMRNKVISEAQILSLIDFGDFKVFEAGIQTMVMLFRKNDDLDNYAFDYRRLQGKNLELRDIIGLLNKEKHSRAEYLSPKIKRSQFIDKTLTFSNSDVQQVLEKISSKANFHLDQRKEVAQGIVCPQDYVNKTSQKVLGGQFKVGDGIFTLSDDELRTLRLSIKESPLVKPFYTTDELHRWWANSRNQKWVIYTDSSFKNKRKIEDYPNIKKHLDQFRKVITSDNKPYGLHRARDEYFFKGEKIIAVRKCAHPTFTYVDFDSYVSATFYLIKTERVNQKYLTGVLNSELITFWLKHKGKMQGTNFQIDKEPILALPLMDPEQEDQNKIADIVTKILAITKDDDYLQNPTKQAKVREYEKQIDQLIYKLYGLTDEEIKIVEQCTQ